MARGPAPNSPKSSSPASGDPFTLTFSSVRYTASCSPEIGGNGSLGGGTYPKWSSQYSLRYGLKIGGISVSLGLLPMEKCGRSSNYQSSICLLQLTTKERTYANRERGFVATRRLGAVNSARGWGCIDRCSRTRNQAYQRELRGLTCRNERDCLGGRWTRYGYEITVDIISISIF